MIGAYFRLIWPGRVMKDVLWVPVLSLLIGLAFVTFFPWQPSPLPGIVQFNLVLAVSVNQSSWTLMAFLLRDTQDFLVREQAQFFLGLSGWMAWSMMAWAATFGAPFVHSALTVAVTLQYLIGVRRMLTFLNYAAHYASTKTEDRRENSSGKSETENLKTELIQARHVIGIRSRKIARLEEVMRINHVCHLCEKPYSECGCNPEERDEDE